MVDSDTKKPPARARRADILAAAEREFAAAGYSGGRIERIASSAGVNKQLLFHYFGSKDGLFLSALTALLARCEPPAGSPAEHPAAEIRQVLSSLQAAMRALPGMLGIIGDAAANDHFPTDAARLVLHWRNRLLERLRAAIDEGQRRGYFRDDVDPQALAGISFAAALGAGAVDTGGDTLPIAIVMTDYCAWR
jgi:TetR/AcrR family transcriptional regulator